ncbi:unnamed protein product, partial [Vitis vinifera]
MMKRTLLMPSLSASLFYKEIDLLQPISFDKVFQFERFNSLCNGFVRLGRYSDLSNRTQVFELQKGSGRKWTIERDLDQLREFSKEPYDGYEVIRILGKNPFLWHDHWPVKDYAKVFDCLVLVEEISKEADKVVSKIREMGRKVGSKAISSTTLVGGTPFLRPLLLATRESWTEGGEKKKILEQGEGNQKMKEVTLADQTTYDAKVVGFDQDKDVAVLRVDAPNEKLRPIPPVVSADLLVGQKVYASGSQ